MPQALIVGVGDGLSASVARLLAREGYSLALAARSTGKLQPLAAETRARVVACNVAEPDSVAELFEAVPGPLDVVVFNPSQRVRGRLVELDPAAVRDAIAVTAFGAFLVGQQAARRMLPERRGTILFTGASAGVKGFPQSAPFAMGKFALRGLAQSMARELHPQGVHVAHVVVDGGIRSARRSDEGGDSLLDPDAIAETFLHLIRQHRSAWTDEVAVRPWVETF